MKSTTRGRVLCQKHLGKKEPKLDKLSIWCWCWIWECTLPLWCVLALCCSKLDQKLTSFWKRMTSWTEGPPVADSPGIFVNLTHLNTINKKAKNSRCTHEIILCWVPPVWDATMKLECCTLSHAVWNCLFPKADFSAKKENYASTIGSFVKEFNQCVRASAFFCHWKTKLFSILFLEHAEELSLQ